jgi:hypothetical protein
MSDFRGSGKWILSQTSEPFYRATGCLYKKDKQYPSPIEKNEMGGHVACMGQKRGAYRILVGRHDGRRPVGRPRRRWEDNIKMDLQ